MKKTIVLTIAALAGSIATYSQSSLLLPGGATDIGTASVPQSTKNLNVTSNSTTYVRAYNYSSSTSTAVQAVLRPLGASGPFQNVGLRTWGTSHSTNGMIRPGTGALMCQELPLSIGTYNNYEMSFWTNNFERMKLTTAGNLAIGRNDALQRIHMNGNLLLDDESFLMFGGTGGPVYGMNNGQWAMGYNETKAAFDTETAFVCRAVDALDMFDHAILDLERDLAANAAEGADAFSLGIIILAVANLFLIHDGCRHQGAGWAGLNAFAAGHTRGLTHGVRDIKDRIGIMAAAGHSDHVIDLNFAAGADTEVA